MTAYNVVNRSEMQGGQPEDISDVVANFDAIASVVNGQLDDSNIKAAAGLQASKFAGYPSDGTKALLGDGSWGTPAAASTGNSELAYGQVTADTANITATTEATAVNLITTPAATYDGSKIKIEFHSPNTVPSGELQMTLVWLRDAIVIGQTRMNNKAVGASVNGWAGNVAIFDTPPAGSHTYSVKAFVASNGVIFKAGAGGAGAIPPSWLRVTKDPALGAQGPPGPSGGATTTVATSVAGLGTKNDGKMGLVRCGATPFDFVQLIYDATYGKWVSAPIPLWQAWNKFVSATSYADIGIGSGNITPIMLLWKAFQAAGLNWQFSWFGGIQCAAGQTAFGIRWAAYTANLGDTTYVEDTTNVFGEDLTFTASATVIRRGPWVDINPSIPVKDFLWPTLQLKSDGTRSAGIPNAFQNAVQAYARLVG